MLKEDKKKPNLSEFYIYGIGNHKHVVLRHEHVENRTGTPVNTFETTQMSMVISQTVK